MSTGTDHSSWICEGGLLSCGCGYSGPHTLHAPAHGTGWREDAQGWSVVPGYCWCGKRARECPEPKIDVSAAAMSAAEMRVPSGTYIGRCPLCRQEVPHDE